MLHGEAGPLAAAEAAARAISPPGGFPLAHAGGAGHWDGLGLALAALVVTVVVAGLRRGPRDRFARRLASFVAGWGLLTIALWSPLHDYGHDSFALHMAQHLLLIAIVPPLLLHARIGLAVRDALPRRWLVRSAPVLRLGHRVRGLALSGPGRVAIAFAHATVLWTTHTPWLYEAALFSSMLHHAEHGALLLSAYAVWWSAMTAPAARSGGSILALGLSGAAGGVLATLIIVSPTPWSASHDPQAVGLPYTLLEDQQLGGGVMLLVGSVVWTLAAVTCFVRWLRATEHRQQARERRALRADPDAVAGGTTERLPRVGATDREVST